MDKKTPNLEKFHLFNRGYYSINPYCSIFWKGVRPYHHGRYSHMWDTYHDEIPIVFV